METNQLQQQLFNYLKELLPPHLSMVDEICDLLDLSADSVYRRIRGEKPISLTELKKICSHYHLSIDQLLQLENETVIFTAPGLNGKQVSMKDYLQNGLRQLKHFSSFKHTSLHYICKDSPIWYFYLFPALGAFKTFFWSKTIYDEPELQTKQFSMEEFSYSDCFAIGQQMLREHARYDTTEIWNNETMHSTISQIAYYRDSGNFKTAADFEAVIQALFQTLDHLQLQAEKGIKFMPGDTEVSYKGPINVFINELIIGNNTFVFSLDEQKIAMMAHSAINYVSTRDKRFADKTDMYFNTLISRSTLISKTGERERNRFFNTIRDKVTALRK
jgi:hypothetical protein